LGKDRTILVHILVTVYYKNKHLCLPSVFMNLLLGSWHLWNIHNFLCVKLF